MLAIARVKLRLETPMTKDITCFDLSGCGMIRRAKIADSVPHLQLEYLYTPTPNNVSGVSFFDAKVKIFNAQNPYSSEYYGSPKYLKELHKSLNDLVSYDRVEMWIGPSLHDHISAFHILSILGERAQIKRRLFVNHLPVVAGIMNEEKILAAQGTAILPDEGIYREAELYWGAFKSSTPELWVNLLNQQSKFFPYFDRIHKRFLLQLPLEPTKLRLVDLQILKHVKSGIKKTVHLLGHVLVDDFEDYSTVNEKTAWDAIFGMANAYTPAISGLPLEPFDYYSDEEIEILKRQKWFNSCPSLTQFGKALLENNANWTDENTYDYWWGGTHITSENIWSFDPKSEKLIRPL